jgi:pimeloyl-ACP methyl ester carboxylesterase
VKVRAQVLHGQRLAYRQAGGGPVVVLVHGITSDSSIWRRVMPELARDFTVLAPDLPGHGESAKPPGDYSLGAHASTLRDLLAALGHERATFVGHSLGGGIAMQLSYQFPDLCERLVLVDSGGLGREVSPLLRAATLPGSDYVLGWLAASRLLDVGRIAAGLLAKAGLKVDTDLREITHAQRTFADPKARSAFVHTLRAVVDAGGQRVSAANRLYLAQHMPVLLIWGERDTLIPLSHGHAAHEQLVGSELEVFADCGHFPQLDQPERLVERLRRFIASTEPASLGVEDWRELLLAG